MTLAREGTRRIVVVSRVETDDSALCFLLDDGEVIRAGIDARHAQYALLHAERHAARGIDGFQLCALDCSEV